MLALIFLDMARPLRIEFSGGCYHVINRGNFRRNLFADGRAGEALERVLGEAATRFGWRVHAYVVMRNHFHLALELTEPNLSEGMRWLQGTWVRRYNGFRKLVGKPFQGRYKALLVERGKVLSTVCHYIHLNPVRAGVVSPAQVAEYSLSSLRWFMVKGRPTWLEPTIVLAEAGNLPDTAAGWRRYVELLAFLVDDPTAKGDLVASQLSRGWCIGSTEFRNEMKREARERGAALESGRFEGIEPESLRGEKMQAWEDRLQALGHAAKIDLKRLGEKKSDPAKVLLAAAMKQSSSASNGWLSERLAMGKPASVSQFARRLVLTDKGARAVRRLLSQVKH
jgi:putative transposase